MQDLTKKTGCLQNLSKSQDHASFMDNPQPIPTSNTSADTSISTSSKENQGPHKTKHLREELVMRSPSSIHGSLLYYLSKSLPKAPLRSYYSTAPIVKPKWFYSTEAPVSMPAPYKYKQKAQPEKFQEFSDFDNDRLETAYSQLKKNPCAEEKVPVNEDFLFEADLNKRQMAPVYWDGAVYEIRRGIWFTTIENKQVPVAHDLTNELETAYQSLKPYEKKPPTSASPLRRKKEYYELQGEYKEGKYIVFTDHETAYVVSDIEGIAAQVQLTLIKNTQVPSGLGGTKFTRGITSPKVLDFTEDATNPEEKSFLNLSKMFEMELSQMFGEKSTKAQDATTKQAMKLEIANDYKTSDTDGNRKINHVIFCIHGIGQVLGTKYQAINFTHTINILRKNIKKVYKESPELQALKAQDQSNCGIQVLPVSWRHKVDFTADQPVKENMPSLTDITVDEIKPIRNLLGSVLLDILLYYEPRYLNQILDEVVSEINSIYKVFKARNPDFNGRISIIGHSLGSAITFDLLSMQASKSTPIESLPAFHQKKQISFPVENFFAIGSPVGVFNLLKKKNIGSRAINGHSTDDISVPRCENLYNIFHPCDPIAYRMEPLISRDFSVIKPDSVPFLIENINKHISSLASIGDKVYENATKTWSTVAAKTASNTLNKLVSQAVAESSDPQTDASSLSTKETEMTVPPLDSKLPLVKKKKKIAELTPEQYAKLVSLNKNARVDYALQQGLLDISIISSISAHISYFEDENIAAFILREVLNEKKEGMGLDDGGVKRVRLF
ncbi:hypothetical protein WICPIJ_005490 [Wickerhamomyces pijperi]|uniref:DDHD domain-containing protein n=1 Tax=Wickerhamomyces pijperi TaxID=599730 RepID=A0A9P8Q629_WICPI|nr:hypothetical protein WICPIJ_005490 [Wickerhamomyces pijperi]